MLPIQPLIFLNVSPGLSISVGGKASTSLFQPVDFAKYHLDPKIERKRTAIKPTMIKTATTGCVSNSVVSFTAKNLCPARMPVE